MEYELTLKQRQEIDQYLEDYAKNPSNSNKYRIGLHAHLNDLISIEVAKAFQAGHEDCKLAGDPTTHKFFKEATAKEVAKARLDELKMIENETWSSDRTWKYLGYRIKELTAEVESNKEGVEDGQN